MNTGPSLDAYLEQLAKGHGFTVEQLAANRVGKIDPAQAARGRKSGLGCVVALFALATLCLVAGEVGALLFYEDLRPPISSVDMNAVYAFAAGGVLAALIIGIAAIVVSAKIRSRRREYSNGRPGVVEGPVQKERIIGRRGASDMYRYRIGGRSFYVSRAGWDLVTQGARYRAYFVAGDLLSIEPA